jgi:DNA replication initiation complex subunit (GINS family)
MDIHITYETLFDLLRKERSLEELQPLDPQFWNYVVDYLQERKKFFEGTSSIEQEKTRFQLQNIKRIVKEIYERRERKIISLALNVNKTENTTFFDTKHMLAEEKLLFHETVKLLTKYKHNILTQVCNFQNPSLNKLTDDMSIIEAATKRETEEALETKNRSEETKLDNSSVGYKAAAVKVEPATTDEKKVEPQAKESADKVKVKFTTQVPKFIGKDKEVFGPYDQGTTADLPKLIATILVKKGKAQVE